jgi:hypothetical protein
MADADRALAADYYADAAVRRALRTYAGATATHGPTAAFLSALDPAAQPFPTWSSTSHVPWSALPDACDRGCDLSRALWDTDALIFAIDLDYQNLDYPGEPFLHASSVFFKLENSYAALRRIFRRFGLPIAAIATGRGYHFVGRVPLESDTIDRLTTLSTVPAWYATHERRRPPFVAPMTPRQAQAAEGLGLLIEHVAHLAITEATPHNLIPLVVNGVVVGSGEIGRECVSIDFSHVGDPLDTRHVRMAFSAYQWHRARPDIFGPTVAALPPLAALPRRGRSLEAFLLGGRDLKAARAAARTGALALPNVSRGIDRLIRHYRASPLARFHEAFAAERRTIDCAAVCGVPDLPPCLARPLVEPNDLLLKPEYLQNLVRGLLARGWSAARIAALVEREYRADHQWGDRWTRLDARTRADFDVRVFAGLVLTGHDRLIDFNCVSSREKGICPESGCGHDLDDDRRALVTRVATWRAHP